MNSITDHDHTLCLLLYLDHLVECMHDDPQNQSYWTEYYRTITYMYNG